jgi:hypothetical protein
MSAVAQSDIPTLMLEVGRRARAAAKVLAFTSAEQKRAALNRVLLCCDAPLGPSTPPATIS